MAERPMLHIASAHSGSPRWLAIQRRALAEHLSVPYTTLGLGDGDRLGACGRVRPPRWSRRARRPAS